MHANLIPVNITVGVPTLQMGFDADAMESIQEGCALVGIIIINPVIINVICLKCQCMFICFHPWEIPIHAVLPIVFGSVFIEVSKRLGFTDYAIYFHGPRCHSFEHDVSSTNSLKQYVTHSW